MKFRVIDYTINEFLRLGVTESPDISSVLQVIKKYDLDLSDVNLNYIEKSSIRLPAEEVRNLRCNTVCDLAAIKRATGMGFHKIRFQAKFDPALSIVPGVTDLLEKMKEIDLEVYLEVDNLLEYTDEAAEKIYPLAEKYKIKRLLLGDKKASMDPFATYDRLAYLIKTAVCPLEYTACNDYGLATANTLSAIKAGVAYVGASIGGIGNPGMAATEEILMSAKHLWKDGQVAEGGTIAKDCADILGKAGIALPGEKAVIGKNIFAHESGIHVDGIVKNPELYEVIKPEEVGLTRLLIIGKFSGTASLIQKFRQFQIELSQEDAGKLLNTVRNLADIQKGPLSDEQLKMLYDTQCINKIN